MVLKEDGDRMTINGVEHWYRVAGDRNSDVPLVILHGGPGGNEYVFERTIGPLLESFASIVYYEQRGCGRSMSPKDPDDYSRPILVSDLDNLRTELGIERMHLLGFSFGSELALEYTLQHPGRIGQLVLQCPSVAEPGRIAAVQLYGLASVARGGIAHRIRGLIDSDLPLDAKHAQAWEIADTETVDRLLFVDPTNARRNRSMWEESGLLNTGEMARALSKQKGIDVPLSRRMAAVQQPTLVLSGLHDRNVGVDVARDVSIALPDARLKIFNHSAHFPDFEESVAYAAAVEDFLG
jgi:proline iminopeptidase